MQKWVRHFVKHMLYTGYVLQLKWLTVSQSKLTELGIHRKSMIWDTLKSLKSMTQVNDEFMGNCSIDSSKKNGVVAL